MEHRETCWTPSLELQALDGELVASGARTSSAWPTRRRGRWGPRGEERPLSRPPGAGARTVPPARFAHEWGRARAVRQGMVASCKVQAHL